MSPDIFDTHAHYQDEQFDSDRDELLEKLPSLGIEYVVNCGTDVGTSLQSLKMAEKYPFIYAACGIHPHECSKISDGDFAALATQLKHKKCVAIGEIGLDYHYDFSPRELQLEVFERQLKTAVYLDIPVIIHDREAHADTLELLKKYSPRGVVHCFSGSVEMANDVVKLGMYIGLGGAVTFKNARKPLEVAEHLPFERLLLETDCPYMAPEPYRGRRCDSSYIPVSAQKIAEVKGVDVAYVIAEASRNAKKLFGIK